MPPSPPRQRVYDHRLRQAVWETGNTHLFPELHIPRSTLAGWLRDPPPDVVTADCLVTNDLALALRVKKIERRCCVLTALVRLLLALVRVHDLGLSGGRIPDGALKARILRAIKFARKALPLAIAHKVLSLSPGRYRAWRRAARGCRLDDRSSCPKTSPSTLTAAEMATMREMVTSPDYRHMSLGCLALFAQREGKLYAAPSTWRKLARERGWSRPRMRVHPVRPKIGIRAEAPNLIWHIDTTLIRLLDGTKLYLQGIIDNFSRRILCWSLKEKLEPKVTTCELLKEAAAALPLGASPPQLMVDGGIENLNESVDALVSDGVIRRVIAQVDLRESNSLIERWWRSLNHNWLFLNELDTPATVRRLVAFYVEQHNQVMPHWAHKGHTPDEVYFGTGDGLRERLRQEHAQARQARLMVNQEETCETCGASEAEPVAKDQAA